MSQRGRHPPGFSADGGAPPGGGASQQGLGLGGFGASQAAPAFRLGASPAPHGIAGPGMCCARCQLHKLQSYPRLTTTDSRNARQQGRSRRCGPLVGRAHIRSSSHRVCLHSEAHSRESTVLFSNNNTLDSPQTGLSPHWDLIQVRVAASCACSAHRSAGELSELTAQMHRTGLRHRLARRRTWVTPG
jgi:hypothetical protein